ncbi:3-deoxy-D-manno-octulosonic acid kinase, partial [Vibrio parahaemolyticus]|nr:3-deoxy-D-manno-octulosonic acid kinase [Vibrio parahaemolyticus]
ELLKRQIHWKERDFAVLTEALSCLDIK